MSFVLRSHRDRYRQRAREGFYRSLMILMCIIVALILGYIAGQKKQEQDIRQLRNQNSELQDKAHEAEQDVTRYQADHQTLLVKYRQLESRYKRDVPQGDLGLLTSLVREQMDKGLAVERMAQIIRAAQPPQNCSQAVNKRFILSTPAYKGPESAITFAEGAITIRGSGQSSINAKQEKEAWFDPGKPITIKFTLIGGKTEEKTGLLPMHHTIIMRDKEHRFTISEGPRSFVIVSGDYCDYPESLMNTSFYSKSDIVSSM